VIAVRKLTISLLLLCAAALASPCRAQEAIVTLKARAEVVTANVRLGDIAEIQSKDRRLVSQLREISIGQAPRIGYALSVRRDDLADLLAGRYPAWRTALRWRGPEAVSVSAGGAAFDAASLVDSAAQALYRAILERYAYTAVRISLVGNLERLMLPDGAVQAVPQVITVGAVAKRMCVHMHVTVDNLPYRTIPLWFAVEAERPVATASEDLHAGEALLPEKFSTRLMDATLLRSDPVSPESIRPALRLKHALAGGAPLLAAHVETLPPVVRNQRVEVRVVTGPIRIETSAIAMADGRLGELVRVRNVAADKEAFNARVVADGVVMIDAR
jgi:flagella basal body P-ring formation protein FlgA